MRELYYKVVPDCYRYTKLYWPVIADEQACAE